MTTASLMVSCGNRRPEEIAKLRKTKGVQELDEEEYSDLLEKQEEELTVRKTGG